MPYPRYTNWVDAGYYKAVVTIDGAYDFEVIFLVSVSGEISCKCLLSSIITTVLLLSVYFTILLLWSNCGVTSHYSQFPNTGFMSITRISA